VARRPDTYGGAMRDRPLLHPSAELIGAAPRPDGLWVSLWATADGVVCPTIGSVPGDASTAKRSVRYADRDAARVAIRDRLDELWSAYLAEGPVARERFGAGLHPRPAAAAPVSVPVTPERPVPADVVRRAAQHGRILGAR
jgi:hypothetical protein